MIRPAHCARFQRPRAAYGKTLLGAAALLAILAGSSLARAAEVKPLTAEGSQQEYQQAVRPFLAKHCAACHGDKVAEKELNLATLPHDMKATTSAARWAVVLTQLLTGEMPPKEEPRPNAEATARVVTWIQGEMKRSGKHLAQRAAYQNGNSVDHGLLFAAAQAAPFDAAPRLRRLSPEIYAGFTKDVGGGLTVGQPFSPEGKTTFKDMGTPKLDEPITAQLIDNALLIVEKRLLAHKLEDGVPKAAQGAPQAIVRLLDEKSPAGDPELDAAITAVFDLALRRAPSPAEVTRFRELFQKNIASAGRPSGVKYSLAAVLLLPEAVLRSELGSGTPDAEGRLRLAPREIAFALAYAVSDRRPEPWLLADAEAGKLDTREGVAAAAQKLLADPKLEKTRILRFFREYFGYAEAADVFKNPEDNREHYARELVADTDRLIEWILERDQQVFRELLTTNKAFVNIRWDGNKREIVRARNDVVHLAYNLPPDWKWTAEQPIELPAEQRSGILTQPSWLVAKSKSDENHAIIRGKWVRERLLGNVVPDVPITVDAQLPVAPEKTLRERMAVTQEAYCWQCHRLMNRVGLPFEQYDHFGRFRATEKVLDLEATARNLDPKGKPLGPVLRGVPADGSGGFEFVGDSELAGDVNGAIPFLHRLADSVRVEQVFVRHAFRYWLGRNESPGDAPSLRAAHAAYRSSGGSMRALIVALVASDSFLYRLPDATAAKP